MIRASLAAPVVALALALAAVAAATGLLIGLGAHVTLDDHREVDGVLVPHRLIESRKGARPASRSWRSGMPGRRRKAGPRRAAQRRFPALPANPNSSPRPRGRNLDTGAGPVYISAPTFRLPPGPDMDASGSSVAQW